MEFSESDTGFFIDINNVYASSNPSAPQYTFQNNKENTAFLTTDGNPLKPDGRNGIPVFLLNADGEVQPTVGFILEF